LPKKHFKSSSKSKATGKNCFRFVARVRLVGFDMSPRQIAGVDGPLWASSLSAIAYSTAWRENTINHFQSKQLPARFHQLLIDFQHFSVMIKPLVNIHHTLNTSLHYLYYTKWNTGHLAPLFIVPRRF